MQRIPSFNRFVIGFVCLILILVAALPQFVSAQQEPPPEAIEACEGASAGNTCQLSPPQGGTVSGVCQNIQSTLTCVPSGGMRGERRGDMQNPPSNNTSSSMPFRQNQNRSNAGNTAAPISTPTTASAPANDPGVTGSSSTLNYRVVDTGQTECYNAQTKVNCATMETSWQGQDAQHNGYQPSYTNNGDGTVTDNVTGLMWQQGYTEKMTYDEAVAAASSFNLAGYSDWRLPTIKELYSLIDFSGTDPSGETGNDTSTLKPFIDTTYFDFAYGDPSTGERIIDAQYASSTLYIGSNNQQQMVFGVNFADGRIKGYGTTLPGRGDKTFYVKYVRGTTTYGTNSFVNNGDGTITDQATGLMWAQNDSGTGLNWQSALEWVQQKNAESYLGYSDWRLPNAKELQSIVDYTKSPDTSGTAAIDSVFNASSITNEPSATDFPYYWSSTTHIKSNGMGDSAAYLSFGRALGYMNNAWIDVHGAGAQRSDPKIGDPANYATGRGPQGDAIRIYNYVRLVRDV